MESKGETGFRENERGGLRPNYREAILNCKQEGVRSVEIGVIFFFFFAFLRGYF